MKIVVLGGGLVGGPMAQDLCQDEKFDVTVVDYNQNVLDKLSQKFPKISTIQEDLTDSWKTTELVSGFDMAVNAVPGFMGFETAKAIIEAGRTRLRPFWPRTRSRFRDCSGSGSTTT